MRNCLSHAIRIFKVDCTEFKVQLACANLISRIDLLMKLFSGRENVKETPTLWKSSSCPMKNVANLSTGSPRKLGKPDRAESRCACVRDNVCPPSSARRPSARGAVAEDGERCWGWGLRLQAGGQLTRIRRDSGTRPREETSLHIKAWSQQLKAPGRRLAVRVATTVLCSRPSSQARQLSLCQIASQGIPESGYGKRLFAISVSAVVTIIISVICLFEICSQHSATKDGTPQEKRTFLGRKKKGAKRVVDEVGGKSMVDKQYDEESLDNPLCFMDTFHLEDEVGGQTMDEEYTISSGERSAPPPLFAPQPTSLSVPPTTPMYVSLYVPTYVTPSAPTYVTPSAPTYVTPSERPYLPPSERSYLPPSIHLSQSLSVHGVSKCPSMPMYVTLYIPPVFLYIPPVSLYLSPSEPPSAPTYVTPSERPYLLPSERPYLPPSERAYLPPSERPYLPPSVHLSPSLSVHGC
ncbi:uncharacterized protein LOC128331334 [Hemicordylus capensis]|uniref:uncharacterized protein LOC128331334 n=1 Tax=Hemicordylus capensis TaxID=884348 RepID=UPI0023040A2D|nr:uncharacterized protein LOC128331334 [Hemicordylus capensis]